MAGTKHLAILVSANGYGHIRRQILITSELLKQNSNLHVQFAITDAQFQRFKLEIENLGSRASAVVGVTEDSVRWRHDPSNYTATNLNGWESELMSRSSLIEADFVLSDNLVGVLEIRPDAVLSGSFLWHEVIDAYAQVNDACRQFVEREINLLKKCVPKMICNADLATPAVLSLTDAVRVPWMIEETVPQAFQDNLSKESERTTILVHGGGTRTLDDRVRMIAQILRNNNYTVFTDLEDDLMCFDYQDSSWQQLGAVICRPGVGTATECVKWKVPMFLLRDKKNFEAEFIGQKLEKLGLAYFFENQEEVTIVAHLHEAMSLTNVRKYLKPFESCKINGIAKAASFLAEHWKLIGRSE